MRDYYITKIKKTEGEIHPIIKVFVQAYNKVIPKIVSVLYL